MSASHSSASSVSHSSSSSAHATATTWSLAPLPRGCAGLSGTHGSAGFKGCVVGNASVLQSCCSSVGSTPVFANETCGCPFNSDFLPTDYQNFYTCLDKSNEEGGCSGIPISAAAPTPRPEWNAALIVLDGSLLVAAAVGL